MSTYRYNGSITDERMEVFLEMLYGDMPKYLCDLKQYASDIHEPVMRSYTAWCLKYHIESLAAKNVLEIGTAIGYSALFMAWCDKDVHIDTIEKVPERISAATHNFEKYDSFSQITQLEGDAADVLSKLATQEDNKGRYDIIFLDAAKAQYLSYLTSVEQLIRKGGVLITDNVLQEGMLLESRYAVERRDRTIHKRMREYLYELTHSDKWSTMIIPAGDGIAVSTKLN